MRGISMSSVSTSGARRLILSRAMGSAAVPTTRCRGRRRAARTSGAHQRRASTISTRPDARPSEQLHLPARRARRGRTARSTSTTCSGSRAGADRGGRCAGRPILRAWLSPSPAALIRSAARYRARTSRCGADRIAVEAADNVAAAEHLGLQAAPVGAALEQAVDQQLHRVHAVAPVCCRRHGRREHEVVHPAQPGTGRTGTQPRTTRAASPAPRLSATT